MKHLYAVSRDKIGYYTDKQMAVQKELFVMKILDILVAEIIKHF